MPVRDSAVLASNGELSIAANPAYANLRIVAVIEPDSLPNLVTNANNIAACQQALQSGVYVQGVQYAITQLHPLSNVYQYLDIGHSGWLGWPSNMTPAINLSAQVVGGTPLISASFYELNPHRGGQPRAGAVPELRQCRLPGQRRPADRHLTQRMGRHGADRRASLRNCRPSSGSNQVTGRI